MQEEVNLSNRISVVKGLIIGGLIVLAVVLMMVNNDVQWRINDLKAGNLDMYALSAETLDPDIFTAVQLQMEDGTIVTGRILDGSVEDGLLAGDVTLITEEGDEITFTVLDSYQIADGSVVEQMLDGGVQEKLNNISTVQIQNDTIVTSKLADGSVTTVKLADGAVVEAKLANGAVTSIKIQDGTIVDADISTLAAIAWSKIDKTGSSIADLTTRDAEDVDVNDAGGYYTTDNVEAALQELGTTAFAIPSTYLKLDATNGPVTGALRIQPAADTTSAFEVQDIANNPILSVDTLNGRVGIGTVSPEELLQLSAVVPGIGYKSVDTDVQTDESLGRLIWSTIDDQQTGVVGQISLNASAAFGNVAGADTYLSFATNVGAAGNIVESMRITDGKVGIGNINPDTALHVYQEGESTLTLEGARGQEYSFGSINFVNASDGDYTGARIESINQDGIGKGNLAFSTYASGALTERLRISAEGYVGIGDTSPTAMLTVGDGDLFQVSSTGAVTAPVVNKVVVVDGNTYPQTCAGINAAIDALGVNGGEVYMPEGTYTCAETVTIDADNTTLKGAGWSTIIDASASQAFGDVIVAGKNYLTFSDFKIVGNAGGGDANSLIDSGGRYNTFDHLFVADSDDFGLDVGYADHTLVTDSLFEGNDNVAIYFHPTAETNTIANNHFRQNFNDIYIGRDSYGSRVVGNLSEDVAQYAIRLSNNLGTQTPNNLVEGNTIINPGIIGIYVINEQDYTTVTGNSIYDDGTATGAGIRVDSDYNIISNNTVQGFTYINAQGIDILSNAIGNVVSHNNVINNTVNVADAGTNTTIINSEAGLTAFGLTTTPAALVDLGAATTAAAQLHLTTSAGTDPSAPNDGDVWYNGTNLYFNDGATSIDLLTGAGAGGSVGYVQLSPTSVQATGDVTTPLIYLNENGTGTPNLMQLQVGGSDKFVVDNGGQIGIGTSNPQSLLHINAVESDTGGLRIYEDDSARLAIYPVGGGSVAFKKLNGGGNIQFLNSTGDIEMLINQAGHVGIGDTTPASLFTVGDGDLFQVSSTGAVTAPVVNKVVVVDGNTYPQTCAGINAAIDDLGVNGGEVYLPEGTYTCAETITIDVAYTTLKGAGRGTIIDASGANLDPVMTLYLKNHVVIEDMQIIASIGGTGGSTIEGGYSQFSVLRNLYIKDSDYNAIYLSPHAHYSLVEGNFIENADNTGIDAGGDYVRIVHNTIQDAYNGIGSTTGGNKVISNNTIVSTAADVGWDGITFAGGNANTVSNNTIEGYDRFGIRIQSSAAYNTITGNTVKDTGNNSSAYAGIRIGSSNNLIDGNNIYDTLSASNNAIYIEVGVNDNLISNNSISGINEAGSYAINVAGGTNNTLANNLFASNANNILDLGTNTTIINSEAGLTAFGLTTTPAALVDLGAATTAAAQLHLTTSAGTDPSAPNNGDLWYNGTNLYFNDGATSIDLLTGAGAGGSVGYVQLSPTSVQATGDVTTPLIYLNENGTGTPNLMQLQVGGSDKFVIDNDGNVGIGTASPGTKLAISGATAGEAGLVISNNTTGSGYANATGIQFSYGSTGTLTNSRIARILGVPQSGGGGDLYFETAPSASGTFDTRMVILRGGNVGISDTTPDYLLELSGSTTSPTFALSDSDVAHDQTAIAEADVFSYMTALSGTDGGTQWYNFSDGDATALQITGVMGSNTPNQSTPAISLIGGKTNGFGTLSALAANETLFAVYNRNTTSTSKRLELLGDGTLTTAHDIYAGGTDGGGNILYGGLMGGTAGATTDDSYIKFGAYLNAAKSELDYLALTKDGRFGLSTTTPDAKLHIKGTADDQQLIVQANATQNANLTEWQDSSGNVLSGVDERGILFSNAGTAATNLFVGQDAGNAALTSINNVGLGSSALTSITTGGYNTAVGASSLSSALTASYNVAFGGFALRDLDDGTSNTAVGYSALQTNVTGSQNVAVGRSALGSNAGSYNVAMGVSALSGGGGSTTYMTAIGHNSGINQASGIGNTYLGAQSGFSQAGGSYNIFLGYRAGYRQTTASNLFIVDNQQRTDVAEEQTNAIFYGTMASTPTSQSLRINAATSIPDSLVVDGSSDEVQLTVQANATQNTNLTEWQNSSGTVLSVVDNAGYLGVMNDNPTVPLQVTGIIKTDFLQIENGNPYLYLRDTGASTGFNFTSYSTGALALKSSSVASGSSGTQQFIFTANGRLSLSANISPASKFEIVGDSNIVQQVVRGNSYQNNNLTEWQNSSGTALTVVDGAGAVGVGTSNPDQPLEVNTAGGAGALRLTYNDADGSAQDYTDFVIDSGGNLSIQPTTDGGTTRGTVAISGNLNVVDTLNINGSDGLNFGNTLSGVVPTCDLSTDGSIIYNYDTGEDGELYLCRYIDSSSTYGWVQISNTAGSPDLAEYVKVNDSGITGGDIVMATEISSANIYDRFVADKAFASEANRVIGVISSDPGMVLGGENNPGQVQNSNLRPLALAGRVPVKVVSSGVVPVGTEITASDLPGIGEKLAGAGVSIGTTLSQFDPASRSCSAVGSADGITWPSVDSCFILPDGRYVSQVLVLVNIDRQAAAIQVAEPNLGTETNVSDLDIGLDVILQLHPAAFDWSEAGTSDIGLVVSEVEAIAPRLVKVSETGDKEVRYKQLTAVLTGAVQEQQLQITGNSDVIATLQTDVQQLRDDVTALQQAGGVPSGAVTFADISAALQGNVLGALDVDVLTVNQAATFAASITVGGTADLNGDLIVNGVSRFAGLVMLSGNSVGSATVVAGTTSVDIAFDGQYPTIPIVSITPNGLVTGGYYISSKSESGFTVVLEQAQSADITFDWYAFGTN